MDRITGFPIVALMWVVVTCTPRIRRLPRRLLGTSKLLLHRCSMSFDVALEPTLAQNRTPSVQLLLPADTDASIRDATSRRPIDLTSENESLKGTDTYWQLSDARYEDRGDNP